MKATQIFLVSLFLLGLAACNDEKATTNSVTTDSLAITVTGDLDTAKVKVEGDDMEASFSALKHFAAYSEDFQLLITNLDGLFRGVTIGMSKAEVKKLETDLGKLTKETATELNYTASLGEGETAKITYLFKDDKVNAINAEIRVKEVADYEALNAELVDYYQLKFGNMQLDNMQETWQINETHRIKVQDIEKTKTDFYILIEVK